MKRMLDRSPPAILETPSQTAGPYVHIGCLPRLAGIKGASPSEIGASPIADGARGQVVEITGQIFDGGGEAVADALLESWQADAAGLFPGQPGADPAVSAFCRFAPEGAEGSFHLRTIKPGPVQGRDGQVFAPHIALWIIARGINLGLSTRIYFAGDDHAGDPVLAQVPHDRVRSLLAHETAPGAYRFDIHLQGAKETVFLNL